jgi:hypothetical protein
MPLKHSPVVVGQVAALIIDIKPAKQIVDEMVRDAAEILCNGRKTVQSSHNMARP